MGKGALSLCIPPVELTRLHTLNYRLRGDSVSKRLESKNMKASFYYFCVFMRSSLIQSFQNVRIS